MGRSINDIRGSLRRISTRLDSLIGELDSGFGLTAQDEEPAEVGGGDDFADEGTTGEEGEGGDLGDLGEGEEGGDLGEGDLGGGDLGGDLGGGGFGEEGAEGEGEDAIVEEDPRVEALEATVTQLQTALDHMERRFITMQEMMRRINDPFSDPAKGNNALQST